MYTVTWSVFKSMVDAKGLLTQYIDIYDSYYLKAFDGPFEIRCIIPKTSPASSDQTDFETNYKNTANSRLSQFDSDGANIVRVKAAKKGWTYAAIPFEFNTSSLTAPYSKTVDGSDRPGISLKLYNSSNVEITVPGVLNVNLGTATRTVIDFEPPYDYEVIGGSIRTLTDILVDMRLWIIAVPDIPAGSGGSKEMAGGINLRYLSPGNVYQVDGRVSKLLAYDATYHTNKLRLIFDYPAGTVETLSVVMELYRA